MKNATQSKNNAAATSDTTGKQEHNRSLQDISFAKAALSKLPILGPALWLGFSRDTPRTGTGSAAGE